VTSGATGDRLELNFLPIQEHIKQANMSILGVSVEANRTLDATQVKVMGHLVVYQINELTSNQIGKEDKKAPGTINFNESELADYAEITDDGFYACQGATIYHICE